MENMCIARLNVGEFVRDDRVGGAPLWAYLAWSVETWILHHCAA